MSLLRLSSGVCQRNWEAKRQLLKMWKRLPSRVGSVQFQVWAFNKIQKAKFKEAKISAKDAFSLVSGLNLGIKAQWNI